MVIVLVLVILVVVVLIRRMVLRRRWREVESILVLKISVGRVRQHVGEVIVRIVSVRMVTLVLIIGARHHPVRPVRSECVGDRLGEEEVRKFVGIVPTHRAQVVRLSVVVATVVLCVSDQKGSDIAR